MADSINVDVTGIEDLLKRLQSIATEGQQRAVRKAVKAAALVEQAALTEAAPVNATGGGSIPPGALKSDIEIKMKKGQDGSSYAVVGPGKFSAHVGRFVEFGHRLVIGGRSSLNKTTGKTRGPGVQIGVVPEHPWARPTWERTKQEVMDILKATLLEEIDKEVKKGSK